MDAQVDNRHTFAFARCQQVLIMLLERLVVKLLACHAPIVDLHDIYSCLSVLGRPVLEVSDESRVE